MTYPWVYLELEIETGHVLEGLSCRILKQCQFNSEGNTIYVYMFWFMYNVHKNFLFYIYLLQVRVFWSNHDLRKFTEPIVDFPVGHLLALLASTLAYSIIHTTRLFPTFRIHVTRIPLYA